METVAERANTLILASYDRNLDSTAKLRKYVAGSAVPPQSVQTAFFFVEKVEDAVRLAFERTAPGEACLLLPASPSFANFENFEEREDPFRSRIRTIDSGGSRDASREVVQWILQTEGCHDDGADQDPASLDISRYCTH